MNVWPKDKNGRDIVISKIPDEGLRELLYNFHIIYTHLPAICQELETRKLCWYCGSKGFDLSLEVQKLVKYKTGCEFCDGTFNAEK